VVVQCPNCTSKFRIADEKVTDRGVRVRCTACKNVFQVKKGGDLKPAAEGITGTTQEMTAIDPALLGGLAPKPALARPPAAQPPAQPGAAPAAVRKVPPQGASLPPQARPPGLAGKPPGIAARPPGAAVPPTPKPRLQADDLFGMAELTGDAAALPGSPLSSQNNLQPAVRPPPGRPPAARPPGSIARPPTPQALSAPPPPAQPPRPPALSADDFDVDLGGDAAGARPLAPPEPAPRAPVRPPPPPPRTAPPPVRPPPPPQESARPLPPPPPVADEPPPPPPPPDEAPLHTPVKLGAFKTQLKDPFEGVDLGAGESREGADELSADKLGDRQKTKKEPAPQTTMPVEIPPPSTRRELVSSALTGLVGASMALILVLFAAISEGDTTWNPFVNRSDIIATKVVSGLYDTASGKPVFFVRGRVENRGKKVRGPIRVVAELVTETGVESRSEALAGTEPSAEDVFGLRSPVELEKLTKLLTRNDAERRVPPGGSLPFFAVIADPPADLQRHRLHVRLESIDAWAAPTRPAKAEAEPKPGEKTPSPAVPSDKGAAAAPPAAAPSAPAAAARPADAGAPEKPADKPAEPAKAPPAAAEKPAKGARKGQGSGAGSAAAGAPAAAAPAAAAPAAAAPAARATDSAAPAPAETAKAADPTLP
jgi:predicted Zn finger-like uncharacterized protein